MPGSPPGRRGIPIQRSPRSGGQTSCTPASRRALSISPRCSLTPSGLTRRRSISSSRSRPRTTPSTRRTDRTRCSTWRACITAPSATTTPSRRTGSTLPSIPTTCKRRRVSRLCTRSWGNATRQWRCTSRCSSTPTQPARPTCSRWQEPSWTAFPTRRIRLHWGRGAARRCGREAAPSRLARSRCAATP